MNNFFLETGPQITREDISDIENEFQIRFPSDFINHYLTNNGGYPSKQYYKWTDNEGYTRINTFDYIKNSFNNNSIKIEENYRDMILLEEYLPKGIVPFASDDGGNMFCISTRKGDYGYIYYCNNDDYNTENKLECLTLLDKTFREFLGKLVES